jgi:hypothetical protein
LENFSIRRLNFPARSLPFLFPFRAGISVTRDFPYRALKLHLHRSSQILRIESIPGENDVGDVFLLKIKRPNLNSRCERKKEILFEHFRNWLMEKWGEATIVCRKSRS